MTQEQPSQQRVTTVLILLLGGIIVIGIAIVLGHWMTWATGAGIIRLAMWLGED